MRNDYAHPYFRTHKSEQHESARERLEREAREFLARKAMFARKLANRHLIPAHAQ